MSWCQFYDIEDWVEVCHRFWELEFVGMLTHSLLYDVWSEELVGQLQRWLGCFNVTGIKVHLQCTLEQCYEHSLFIASELQYFWNTSGLDLWTPALQNIPRLQNISGLQTTYSDYNSITFLVLLFHDSVLLYPPFDNSEIPVIVLQICLIVPPVSGLVVILFQTYCLFELPL